MTPTQLDRALASVAPPLQRAIRALLAAWDRAGRAASLAQVEAAIRAGDTRAIVRLVLGDAVADTVVLVPPPLPGPDVAFAAASSPAAIAAASRAESAVVRAAAEAAARANGLAAASLPPRPPRAPLTPSGTAPVPPSGVLLAVGPDARTAAAEVRAASRVAIRTAIAAPPPGATAYAADVLRYLRGQAHAGVLAAVTEGNARGLNPRDVARSLRDLVGLGDHQARWVQNLRAELETGRLSDALDRQLLDGVSGRMLRARLASGKPLTPAEIDRIVGRYATAWRDWHAETIARTGALDLLRQGTLQRALEAQRRGDYGTEVITKRWVTRLDGRERDAHRELNGSTIPLAGFWFDDGVARRTPGGWNCRCSLVIRVGV